MRSIWHVVMVAVIAALATPAFAQPKGPIWRYTFEKPADDWQATAFDDAAWSEGRGGFGSGNPPGGNVQTAWTTSDIWLRRAFEWTKPLAKPALWIHHDEDAEVYLNGRLIGSLEGYSKQYAIVPLDATVLAALKSGVNQLAVHCRQTRGGQYIDVEVVDALKPPKVVMPTDPMIDPNAPAPIATPWDDKIDPENVLPEYPRPQLVRDAWKNLNGRWDYAITPLDADRPDAWEGKILVPFCFESDLSGVNRLIQDGEWMWYRRAFDVPADWSGERVWLNFQASDWETVAYVNGREVGRHRGGYTPFSFDITDSLVDGPQELVVRVWDHGGRKAFCSAGKQTQAGVYEPCSGIWQTVWLEPRGQGSIASMKIRGSFEDASVTLNAKTDGRTPASAVARVTVFDGDKQVAQGRGGVGQHVVVPIPNPKPWGPRDPHLYDLKVELLDGDRVLDTVQSYCGLRDIWIDKTLDGPQIVLNGEAFFHFGPLDQGYWPQSGLTPPTEEALLFEVDYLKRIGCNMVRLHIKANPARWYYHCDRLGLMVWQDFVCNKRREGITAEDSELWRSEQVALMDAVNNHPSIVKWIVFNEAWGQHETETVVRWAESLLPDHIVSTASGWTDVDGLGDIRDIHDYSRFPSTTAPECEPKRAVVLGETGGFGVPVNGNNWLEMPEPAPRNMQGDQVADGDRKGGMYPKNGAADLDYISDMKRPVYSPEAWPSHYARYVETLHMEQAYGLSGAVYTQLTDMRHEQNGWLTFDRKVSKIPVDDLRAMHEMLYQPTPKREPFVAFGSTWKGPNGEAVTMPIASPAEPTSETRAYSVAFDVDAKPEQAAINIVLDAQHDGDTFGHLLIYIDGQRVFDDMMRHKKPERRIACVPLTEQQTSLLTPGSHELMIEATDIFPIESLDVSLDAVSE